MKSLDFTASEPYTPSSFLSLPHSLFRRKKERIQASKVMDYYGRYKGVGVLFGRLEIK